MLKHNVGELVWVNLSNGKIKKKTCPEKIRESFLGGRGLASYFLYRYLPEAVNPLSPENILVFAAGLLCGTRMITSSRLHIGARSPLTGLIGVSNGGGKFAAELKKSGIIALIVTGKAEKPVFISIENGNVSIEDASFVWGLNTGKARSALRAEVSDNRAKLIVIGKAGEKLSPLGCVITDIGHACGRTGMGAVMGSKHLKAIVVRNTKGGKSIVSKEAIRVVKEYTGKLRELPCWDEWTKEGSASSVTWTDAMGASGAKNFSQVSFEGVDTACGSHYKDLVQRYHACYNCPIHCRAFVKIDRGRHKGFVGDRGEYEPLSSWGPRCGNADGLESIYFCNLCDDYGIDSVGTGNVVAFAMELYEKGILRKEDAGGLELEWGNVEAMEALVHKIANRSSWLGDVLAQGMVKAARIIGGGAIEYAYHVKGLSITIMDPRGFKATGLAYAVSNRGGDYGYAYAKPEYSYTPDQALKAYGTEKAADRLSEDGKALMVKQCVCACAVVDSLGICKIPEFGMIGDFDLAEAADILSAFTGRPIGSDELMRIGERIFNLERLINFRWGATGKNDTLPQRFLSEPISEGPSKGSVVNLEKMLAEFYSLMGWQEDGTIGIAKMRDLGLLGLDEEDNTCTEEA
ncbi:MAG TPA: aldehyde ferredoxin oxidoreductase family protein [Clostridia bacterium]|nr:aldehyde ferredoxin oxidoreductase family protein [Clostridia bacterium]